MCAAISENGVSTHLTHIGPYNTQLLLAFLNTLYRDLIPEQERSLVRPYFPNYVVVWDNVNFHRTIIVRFAAHERITVEFLPPFPNPIEEFFSVWRWKLYDHRPQYQMSLLDAMNAACEDITADHCRGCVRHSRRIFPPTHGNDQLWSSYVMLRKIFGLTNKSDRMSTKNNLFHGCYFVFLCICGNIRNMKCTVIW